MRGVEMTAEEGFGLACPRFNSRGLKSDRVRRRGFVDRTSEEEDKNAVSGHTGLKHDYWASVE